MLGLAVPGAGMGGSPLGTLPPGSGGRFMLLLGVGRSFLPFALGIEILRALLPKIYHITHLSNIG